MCIDKGREGERDGKVICTNRQGKDTVHAERTRLGPWESQLIDEGGMSGDAECARGERLLKGAI